MDELRYTTRYVALYCRISKDDEKRGQGVGNQQAWGRAYAAERWPGLPVRVFVDNNKSGYADDVYREDFENLRAAIGRGEVAHLWAAEQSRLEREPLRWFVFARELEKGGLSEFHTRREGVKRTRDVLTGIKAVLNGEEIEVLKKRVTDGLDANFDKGLPLGKPALGLAMGVKENGDKTFVHVKPQAVWVVWAGDRVLDGWGLERIAEALRAEGLTGTQGGAITAQSLKKTVTAASIGGYNLRNGVLRPGNWEAVIPDPRWSEIRAKLGEDRMVVMGNGRTYAVSTAHRGNKGRRWLLSGHTGTGSCGRCGAPITGTMRQFRHHRKSGLVISTAPYLLCHPRMGGHGCVGIMMEPTDKVVLDKLWSELDKPEFLDAIGHDAHAPRRDRLTEQLRAVDRQRVELATMWATPGALTMAEWQTARSSLMEQEGNLTAELATIPPPVINVDITAARIGWKDMELDEQRHFLSLFVDKVVINAHPKGAPMRFNADRIDVLWRQR